ncbi:imidazoleglycerol-phosphate dehydratase HisB [Marinicauda algicola]|nr:imidazoleglycerol-phosphate dehydratase HisB [Marinicauda algicola]
MSGFLDLSLSPEATAGRAAADLAARLAALLAVTPERIVLATSPQAARRALGEAGLDLDEDFSGAGVLALDEPSTGGCVLYRLGPDAAPLGAVLCADAAEAEALRARLPGVPLALVDAGLQALAPGARVKARADREERDRVLEQVAAMLAGQDGVETAAVNEAGLRVAARDDAVLHGLGLRLEPRDGAFIAHIPDAATARALAAHLGVSLSARTASVRRTTKETDIALAVDLDGEGAKVSTGVHFFDHMLEQIARHAGISLTVSCEGDVEVDAHHTIEDVCLALGDALRTALGDKRGIGRFGFALPMDETRASVWIDLSGRPYFRFDGEIPGERVGDFPVEMCPHAFRSISETLKASIHVEVDGENAHHMIESCFKAFGRALRQAVRVEDEALPSTKGVL